MRTRSLGLFYLVAVFALAAALSACDHYYDEAPPKPKVTPPPPLELALQTEIRQDPKPNQYAVILRWNGAFQSGPWVVRRSAGKEAATELAALPPNSSVIVDSACEPGKRYRYVLGAVGKEGFFPIGEREVEVPRDFVVRGTLPIPTAPGIKRLFLEEKSILVTNGAFVDLRVDEIISHWGSIETFAPGQKALTGVRGRTPGEVRINARRAIGRLRIVSRGESGGDGTNGAAGRKGASGTTGGPGRWGMNPEAYRILIPNFVDSFKRAMERDPKPPGHPEWQNRAGSVPMYVCATRPTDGGRGADGSNGGDGGEGGFGGDSGRVIVQIKENDDLLISVVSEPGNSGFGGRFGRGGEPGDGGAPGPLDHGHLCPPARNGQPGAGGLDGRQGRPGERGKPSPYCIVTGSRVAGDCASFNPSKQSR